MVDARSKRSKDRADGRVLRSERSREAIVQAMLELIAGGELLPTAQQVADRAELGIRTVFRHFRDMEALFVEIDLRIQAEALPLLEANAARGNSADAEADIELRLDRLLTRRAAFFERIAPYKRAAQLKRLRSPFLTKQHLHLRRLLLDDLLQSLPELARAPEELVHALEQASSYEAWDHYRNDQRLNRARATKAMRHALGALTRSIAS